MAQVAQQYAWRPVRADILPQSQGTKIGDSVVVRIELLDANGKPTNALQNTPLVVHAVEPSGKVQEMKLEVPSGTSSTEFKFQAAEPGLTKMTVSNPENQVLESSNYVLITPRSRHAKPSSSSKSKVAPAKKVFSNPPTSQVYGHAHVANVRLVSLAFDELQDNGNAAAAAEAAGPRIMLQVSGEHDSNVRADNVNFERVSVYYMDSAPSQTAIKVWLTWNHGAIEPNPLVIEKGNYTAEAHWTSGSPVKNATVSIARIEPAVAVQGESSAQINFVEPVSGVAFFNPPASMSVVDEYDLHARFYDIAGNFVRTSDKRSVAVSTSNPILKFKPASQDTDWDFDTNLTPTGWGKAQIEVATPGYPPFEHTLVVTYMGVLLLCIAGGLLGSLGDILTNSSAARGWRILGRLMVGTLAALLCSWAYVIVGLPEVPAGILHSRIAAFGVSIASGWAGIIAVRRVAKWLGMEI